MGLKKHVQENKYRKTQVSGNVSIGKHRYQETNTTKKKVLGNIGKDLRLASFT